MKYLLDTNALLDLIRRRKMIENYYILDLTIYEIGNVIWKETILFKNLTEREAIEFMKNIINILQNINIIRIQEDLDKIMEIAIREELTYYDAAYLYFAEKNKLILVTNDKKLYNVAKSKIKVLHSSDI